MRELSGEAGGAVEGGRGGVAGRLVEVVMERRREAASVLVVVAEGLSHNQS